MKTELVVGGYMVHNNKLLLINHKKHNTWLPPGGHIEKNETPDDALVREFKEELNLNIELLNRNDVAGEGNIVKQLAVPFYCNVHNVENHVHSCSFYLCKAKNLNELNVNKAELNDARWFSIEELNEVHADVKNIGLKAFEKINSLFKHNIVQ